MSLHLEMIQVARLAPRSLRESSSLVAAFLRRQQNRDGGFCDRVGRSDLYYSAFGLDGLWALTEPGTDPFEQEWNRALGYVLPFLEAPDLDLVHLCCVARCAAALSLGPRQAGADALGRWQERITARLETFRAADGGYQTRPGQKHGTAYGAFLVLGAYQDCQRPMPERDSLSNSLRHLETPDGGWANEAGLKTGATNATAAVMALMRQLGVPVPRRSVDWLLGQRHAQGGFVAAPGAPVPDLLSTATALHVLAGEQVPLETLREPCLDFVDSLWTNAGGFHGHWADDDLDVEYTFYGLLTLGHLGG